MGNLLLAPISLSFSRRLSLPFSRSSIYFFDHHTTTQYTNNKQQQPNNNKRTNKNPAHNNNNKHSDTGAALARPVDDLEDVRRAMGVLSEVRSKEADVDGLIAPVEDMYALLARYEVKVRVWLLCAVCAVCVFVGSGAVCAQGIELWAVCCAPLLCRDDG